MKKEELEQYISRMEELESKTIYPAYAQAWTEFKSALVEEYEEVVEQENMRQQQQVRPQQQQQYNKPQEVVSKNQSLPPLKKPFPDSGMRNNIPKLENDELYDSDSK